MNLEDEIDQLYQLPLKDFTPARNALAKQVRGADATSVRTLQKPNAAAWAVNQLYWRDRRMYDRLLKAAENLRHVHRSLLAGKNVDLHDAEANHREAIREATQKVRELLSASGESDSAATMTGVTETLEALPPADDRPGRLSRPLKRMGFEALAGVGPRSASAAPPKLSLVSSREKKPAAKPEVPPARKKEIEELETRLRTAQVEERQLHAELERERREIERVAREHARVEEELKEVAQRLAALRAGHAAKQKAHKAAETEEAKLEQRLEKLRAE